MSADATPPRRGRHVGPLVVLFLLTTLAYWPTFDHGFFAEDHNLVRYFRESPAAFLTDSVHDRLFANAIGVDYWRPVSTFLLGAALSVLDADAVAIRLVHLLLHVLNVWMVYGLVCHLVRDGRRRAGFAAAALFAVHPFGHVASAVISYYATLWCASFLLAAMLARARGTRTGLVLSLVAFACALGSYELAPVLLPWLVLYERAAKRASWPDVARRVLPYAIVFGVYFALRTAVLGRTGGVAFFLADFAPLAAVRNVVAGQLKVLHPTFAGVFDQGVALALFWLAAAGVAGLLARNLVDARRRLPAFALAVAWAVLTALPFATVPINLAVAKYWYLAASGAMIGLALVTIPTARATRWRRTLGYATFFGIAVYYGAIQRTYLHMLRDLVSTENAIHAHLVTRRFERPVDAVFLTDLPRSTPSAIYGHADPLATSIGLNASLSPPLVDVPFTAYFVPPEHAATIARLVADDPRRVVISFADDAPSTAAPVDDLPTLALEAATTRVEGTARLGVVAVRFRAPTHRRFVLRMVTELGWFESALTDGGERGSTITQTVPLNRVLACPENHRAAVFWWVDAIDDAGRPVARSALHMHRPDLRGGMPR